MIKIKIKFLKTALITIPITLEPRIFLKKIALKKLIT